MILWKMQQLIIYDCRTVIMDRELNYPVRQVHPHIEFSVMEHTFEFTRALTYNEITAHLTFPDIERNY